MKTKILYPYATIWLKKKRIIELTRNNFKRKLMLFLVVSAHKEGAEKRRDSTLQLQLQLTNA